MIDDVQFRSLDLTSVEINVPTVIIHGSGDKIVPVSQSEILVEQISGAELIILENIGHIGIVAKMDVLNSVITAFADETN